MQSLLFDPQTSGGLLMAVDADKAGALVERLKNDGYDAARIGSVREGAGLVVEA
jgi:selenide,water dikinase